MDGHLADAHEAAFIERSDDGVIDVQINPGFGSADAWTLRPSIFQGSSCVKYASFVSRSSGDVGNFRCWFRALAAAKSAGGRHVVGAEEVEISLRGERSNISLVVTPPALDEELNEATDVLLFSEHQARQALRNVGSQELHLRFEFRKAAMDVAGIKLEEYTTPPPAKKRKRNRSARLPFTESTEPSPSDASSDESGFIVETPKSEPEETPKEKRRFKRGPRRIDASSDEAGFIVETPKSEPEMPKRERRHFKRGPRRIVHSAKAIFDAAAPARMTAAAFEAFCGGDSANRLLSDLRERLEPGDVPSIAGMLKLLLVDPLCFYSDHGSRLDEYPRQVEAFIRRYIDVMFGDRDDLREGEKNNRLRMALTFAAKSASKKRLANAEMEQ